MRFGPGTASFAIIPKPAPRIPGDPLGVVPVVPAPAIGRLVCAGCCFCGRAGAPWLCTNKLAPCLAEDRPSGEMVIYIPLAEAIACGIVRQSWSDVDG